MYVKTACLHLNICLNFLNELGINKKNMFALIGAVMIHCKIKLLVKIDTFCSVDVNDRSYQMDPVHLRNLLATRRIFLEEYSSADITLEPFE